MSSYDQIAQWYDASVRSNTLIHDLVVPVLFELLGDIRGLHICDLLLHTIIQNLIPYPLPLMNG